MRARTLALSCLLILTLPLLGADPQDRDEAIRQRLRAEAQAQLDKESIGTATFLGNDIEVYSWSWGLTATDDTSTGGGGGAGKVQMQDFHFVKKVDKASPVLFKACATGQHIPSVTFVAKNKDKQQYLEIKFTDVLISSYQTGGSSGDSIPTESISLNFAKVDYRILIGL